MKERIINGGQSNGILSDDWFDVAWSFRFEDRIFSPKGEKGYSVIYLDKLPWDSTSSLCNLVRIAKIRKEESGTDSHDDIAVTHRNTKIKTRALI